MKLFDVTDVWGIGIHLLLTLALLVFVIFLQYLNWKISAIIAGAIIAIGVAGFIYITIKSPEE
ncbi:MAG: hypothetical protein L3J04_04670 [Robiginitomaculum sp.]|nr:hypothetical protein [Robiginitomaculum sp.]